MTLMQDDRYFWYEDSCRYIHSYDGSFEISSADLGGWRVIWTNGGTNYSISLLQISRQRNLWSLYNRFPPRVHRPRNLRHGRRSSSPRRRNPHDRLPRRHQYLTLHETNNSVRINRKSNLRNSNHALDPRFEMRE